MTDQPKGGQSDSPINLQSDFFNRARRSGERVTIFLMNGKKLSGKIRAFDRYTILLDAGNSEEVIFKHAISTVSRSGSAKQHGPKKGKGKRPEGKQGPKAPRASEQPLSHRMDLTALQGGTDSEGGPADSSEAAQPDPTPSEPTATAAAAGAGSEEDSNSPEPAEEQGASAASSPEAPS